MSKAENIFKLLFVHNLIDNKSLNGRLCQIFYLTIAGGLLPLLNQYDESFWHRRGM
jgi:hypothetical protein